jgi:hypothetical protein
MKCKNRQIQTVGDSSAIVDRQVWKQFKEEEEVMSVFPGWPVHLLRQVTGCGDIWNLHG